MLEMGVGEINPAIGETECCANCSKRAVFQPVVDIESLGVSIMHYVADFVEQMTALPAMKKSRGDDVHHNNVFVIINTNKKTVTSREILTEFNINKVPCPRCRYRADKIHNMLKSKLDVGIGDISGICDHCKDKLTQEPCSICKDILKKFLDTSDAATKTVHRPMSSVKVPKLEEKYYLSEGRPKSATEFNIELKVIMQPEIETGSSKPARLTEKLDIPTKPFKIIMQPEIETGSFKPARLSEQFDNATKPSKVIRQPEIETESFKAGLSEKLDIPTKPLQEKRRYTPKTRKSSPDESVITTFLTSFSKPDKDIKGNLPLNEYIFPQVIKKEAITKAALTTSSELIIKTQEKLYKDAKKDAKKLLKEKPSTVSSVEFIEKIRRDIETSKLGEAEDDLRRKQLKEKSSIESSAELETNVGEFKLGTQKKIKGELSKDISKAKDEHELGQEKEGDRKIGAVGKSHSKDTKDILKEKDKLRQEKEGGIGKDAMGKPHSKDMKDISNAKDKYKLGQEKGDDREKEAVGKTKSKDMKDILMVKDKHKLGPEIEGGRAKVTVGKPHSEDMKAISKAKDKYELGQEKDDDRGKEAVGKTKSKDTKDMLKEKDKHKFDQEKEGERGKEAAGKTHTKDMKDIKAEQRKEDLRKLSLEKQKYQTTKKLSPPSKGKNPLEDIKDISKAKDKHKLGLDEDGDREKGAVGKTKSKDMKDISKGKGKHKLGQEQEGDREKEAVGKLHSKDMKDIKAKQRIRKPSLEEVEKQKYQTTKTLLPPPKGPPEPKGKIPLEDIKDISKAKDKHKLGQDEDGDREKGAVGKTKSKEMKDISKGKHTITLMEKVKNEGKDEVKEKPQVETKKTDKSGRLVQEERVKLAHSHALTEGALRTKDMAESMLSKAREKMMKEFDFGKEMDAKKHNLFKLEVVEIMYRLLEDTVKKNKKVKDFLNLRLFTQLSTAAAGDLILKLIKLSNDKRKKERKVDRKHKAKYRIRSIKQLLRHMDCCIESLSIDSSTILDIEDLINPKYPQKVRYKIKHTEIVRNIPDKPMPKMQPDTLLFHTAVKEEKEEETLQVIDLEEDAEPQEQKAPMSTGILRYQLSDRSFIRKGWTMLPTEKIVRKLNVYKVRPTNPEFDWFNHNKKKGSLQYCTGETLAKFDEDGRGRLYYKNGLLALDYYDCEEANAQQRFVVYSSGESSERCRSLPVTVLAMFDYLGSGVVFDHTGKIRVKYNQTEGVVLDRGIGPEARWKWHTLNDPPVLKQVMIDTHSEPPDSTIMKLGAADKKQREVDETMLQIELNNVTKEKQIKTNQKFQPFQISMKSLKINDQFSLKIMDQAHVYLTFNDGSTHIKINLGMVLDSHEIIDTDTADYNDVAISLEQNLPKTESLIELQNKIKEVRRCENMRARYNERVKPTVPVWRADRVIAAVSKPLRPPLATCPQIDHATMDPLVCNLFYGTRFI